MALLQFTFSNIQPLFSRVSQRLFCTPAKIVNNAKDIKKSVFISESNDVYTNLALEDWLYRNFDFTNHHVLMLWRNDPCVVIGKHQNPWVEANVENLNNITERGVQLARRNSGGGTVYQDQGNLNMTFFTTRDYYSRKQNLELIARAVYREYGLKVDIASRDDLLIRECKISGTAARIGRPNAYHHCTLLVEVNKIDLGRALQKNETGIKTKATKSIRSNVINLCEENPKINVNGLVSALGWEYMRTSVNCSKEANQQNGFQLVNPTEQAFPGITQIRDTLSGWEWNYGKTPNFTVTKSFPVPAQFVNNYDGRNNSLSVTVIVENGRVSDVNVCAPPGLSNTEFGRETKVIASLKGRKFTEDIINCMEYSSS